MVGRRARLNGEAIGTRLPMSTWSICEYAISGRPTSIRRGQTRCSPELPIASLSSNDWRSDIAVVPNMRFLFDGVSLLWVGDRLFTVAVPG